jgi:hypothetical protein
LPADAPPVFILERSRLAQKDLRPSSGQFDNRYFHAQTDFPSADEFKKRGIRQIVYVNPRGIQPGSEEDDLNEYFVALAANGLGFTYVHPRPSGFDSALVQVIPRDTIFSQPALQEYASSTATRPQYYHSYYHYSYWHSSSYWSRSTGAWGGASASSGYSSGFSS